MHLCFARCSDDHSCDTRCCSHFQIQHGYGSDPGLGIFETQHTRRPAILLERAADNAAESSPPIESVSPSNATHRRSLSHCPHLMAIITQQLLTITPVRPIRMTRAAFGPLTLSPKSCSMCCCCGHSSSTPACDRTPSTTTPSTKDSWSNHRWLGLCSGMHSASITEHQYVFLAINYVYDLSLLWRCARTVLTTSGCGAMECCGSDGPFKLGFPLWFGSFSVFSG